MKGQTGGGVEESGGRPVRVAFALDSMVIGGTELNMLRQATALDPARVHLRILFNREGPLLDQLVATGLALERVDLVSLKSPAALGTIRRLRRRLEEEQIEVLHAHDIYSNILGALAVRRQGSTRLVVSRRWGTTHYPLHLRLANRYAYSRADMVLANSAGVAASLHDDEGVPRHRIAVVPNFADAAVFARQDPGDRAALRAALGVPGPAIVVGTVANLRPVKDQGTLLRAIAALPAGPIPVHAVIIGEGPSRGELEALARQLGIAERVHLGGAILDASRHHCAFDISVLTSLSEGFPNTLVEAMAARRPVVATRVGGVPDAVREGETGFLVGAGDHAGFADRLWRLITDPALRAQMGNAGHTLAMSAFHEQAVIPQLEQLYHRLRAVTARRQEG